MRIIGGLDIHRRQITYDYLDLDTGEVSRGMIKPVCRAELHGWLEKLELRPAAFALEATTGWRFVVEELRRAGIEPHLAEPAQTRSLRGNKRRAKTDRADARHLRDLLIQGILPESWIPTDFIADLRTKARLRKALVDQRSGWVRRIKAQLFQHGLPSPPDPQTIEGRTWLAKAELPTTARRVTEVALSMIDFLDEQIDCLNGEFKTIAKAQKGCVALQAANFGVGPLISTAMLAELGDVSRLSSSRKAVRLAGIDVTVSESDGKQRGRRHLSRQGPPLLRWALYEAGGNAWRRASPDHDYYLQARERLGSKRAKLATGRRVLRRSFHVLASLGPDAVAPV